MAIADPKSVTTSYTLATVIEDYCSDQRHSSDADERWLVSYMDGILKTVLQVRNANLSPELRDQVKAFRLLEISKAKEAKQHEIDALDREAKKLVA